jgi:hypothetical protein
MFYTLSSVLGICVFAATDLSADFRAWLELVPFPTEVCILHPRTQAEYHAHTYRHTFTHGYTHVRRHARSPIRLSHIADERLCVNGH